MAGLVVATAPSVTYQNNFDDVLAIVRPLVTKKSRPESLPTVRAYADQP